MGEIDLSPTSTFTTCKTARGDVALRKWGRAEGSAGCVLLVHGLGAHSGWFEAMARRLAGMNMLVLSYDQVGFGARNKEPLRSYKQWLEDLSAVYEAVRTSHEMPTYMMANSMGALVAIAAICSNRKAFAGLPALAIFSPGFDGYPQAFTLGYKIRAILSALITPQRLVKLPYEVDSITRDNYVQNWILQDPTYTGSVPGSMLLELLKLSRNIDALLPLRLDVPVLMLTAGVERIVNPEVNRKFFEGLKAPEKKWKVYEESFHDLMFDPVVEQVASDIFAWCTELKRGNVASVDHV